jgi:hypothetical protein
MKAKYKINKSCGLAVCISGGQRRLMRIVSSSTDIDVLRAHGPRLIEPPRRISILWVGWTAAGRRVICIVEFLRYGVGYSTVRKYRIKSASRSFAQLTLIRPDFIII